jgi:CRP-like cAMP-binding protein
MTENKLIQRTFEEGEVIFNQDDPGTEAYFITSGHVTAWRIKGNHKVALATRSHGEMIGEMALIDGSPRCATVIAQSRVEATLVTKADLQKMLAASPRELGTIVWQLLESLRTSNDLIEMYAAQNAQSEE